MGRQLVSSGTEWEDRVGYSRAVRAGNHVHVSGTTAVDDDGNVIAPGDYYEQTKAAFGIVEDALEEAGAGIEDVVRTRIYTTDAEQWPAIGEAHHEFFADVRPAQSLIEVAGLVDPEMVIEVEAVAITDG